VAGGLPTIWRRRSRATERLRCAKIAIAEIDETSLAFGFRSGSASGDTMSAMRRSLSGAIDRQVSAQFVVLDIFPLIFKGLNDFDFVLLRFSAAQTSSGEPVAGHAGHFRRVRCRTGGRLLEVVALRPSTGVCVCLPPMRLPSVTCGFGPSTGIDSVR